MSSITASKEWNLPATNFLLSNFSGFSLLDHMVIVFAPGTTFVFTGGSLSSGSDSESVSESLKRSTNGFTSSSVSPDLEEDTDCGHSVVPKVLNGGCGPLGCQAHYQGSLAGKPYCPALAS